MFLFFVFVFPLWIAVKVFLALTRIVPNYSARFCGIIPSNPELAAGERGKIPRLRKEDSFRICLQAAPARRMRQRAERNEFGGCGGFCKTCPHINVSEIWKARFSKFFIFRKFLGLIGT
jgi:hypothetical protein